MAFKLRITWILVALLCGLAALAASDSGATVTPESSATPHRAVVEPAE